MPRHCTAPLLNVKLKLVCRWTICDSDPLLNALCISLQCLWLSGGSRGSGGGPLIKAPEEQPCLGSTNANRVGCV